MNDPVLTLINKMIKIAESAAMDVDNGEVISSKELSMIADKTIDVLGIKIRAKIWKDAGDNHPSIHSMSDEVKIYSADLALKAANNWLKKAMVKKR